MRLFGDGLEEISRPAQRGDRLLELLHRHADFALGKLLPLGLDDLIEDRAHSR